MTVLESIGLNQSRVLEFVKRYNMAAPPMPIQEPTKPARIIGQKLKRKLRPQSIAGQIRSLLHDRQMDTQEIADALEIDRSCARKHLAQLLKFGHVRVAREAKMGGAGYPTMWGRGEVAR